MTLRNILAWALWIGLTALPVRAQLTEHYTFNTFNGDATLPVPDGNATGVGDARQISGSSISAIGSMTVSLTLNGDFNGDLYAYLRRETGDLTDGWSVLLNRVGRSATSSRGYGDSGFDVTFDDAAANGDIHTYRLVLAPVGGSPLTGSWAPDARAVDPGSVLDTSSRSAFLSVFNGGPVNGTWTLFAADLQSGGTSEIERWGLEFTAVPEPQAMAGAVGAAVLCFTLWRARGRSRNRHPTRPEKAVH